jgi:hypothetical protein
MNVRASSEAVEAIRQRGGRLWVWPGRACCGGTRFIESSTTEPENAPRFAGIEAGGFELYLLAPDGTLPDELEIGLRGKRRPRVEAFWNGCPYVV